MQHQQELVNEINFEELSKIILKRKLAIFLITLLTTIIASIYAWTLTPIYSGTMLIEIGEVIFNSNPNNNKPMLIKSLDSSNDLIKVLNQTFSEDNSKEKGLNIVSENKETNLIQVICENSDKKMILKNLTQVANTVIQRHQLKANYYQEVNGIVRPTIVNPRVNITTHPIRPNKKSILMLGVIGGLVMSLFFVFLLEFLPFNTRK